MKGFAGFTIQKMKYTIKFWTLLAKGQSKKASNFYFINILKILKYAINRDSLLLVTLQYVSYIHLNVNISLPPN